jgi:hypothetical protein
MFDLTVASTERHQRFVQRAIESGQVWVLQHTENPDSWATSSCSFVDDDGQEVSVPIVPFWSDRAYAARCAKGPWSVYEPRAIPLGDFIERVLQDMHHKDVMVGTNWNGDLVGHDMEAIDLAQELSVALEKAAGLAGDGEGQP